MSIIASTYQLFTGASLVSFVLSGLWGCVLAIKGKSFRETYKLALLASHLIFASSCVLLLVLWLGQGLAKPALPLIYSLVALAVLPCVYTYLPKDQPRYRLACLALTCFFASGMVLRALQTLF
jgi:hypothetical protein